MIMTGNKLLLQQQVTVIGSIDLDSQVDEYHAGVALSQHAVCRRRSVRRQHFAPTSLLFVAADAYSRSYCEFFSAANVNSFLSLKRIKITSISNCIEQLNLAWQFASVSAPVGVSLNTLNRDRGKKNDHYDTKLCYLMR